MNTKNKGHEARDGQEMTFDEIVDMELKRAEKRNREHEAFVANLTPEQLDEMIAAAEVKGTHINEDAKARYDRLVKLTEYLHVGSKNVIWTGATEPTPGDKSGIVMVRVVTPCFLWTEQTHIFQQAAELADNLSFVYNGKERYIQIAFVVASVWGA